jgi:tRNA/rRNA methyltransferase
MGLENIRIVLARPLYGGNVGSVCRAMMNMGFSDLAVVPGPLDLFEEELRKMALGALPIYEQRSEFDSVAEAVADCGWVAGTSARTGFYRDQARPIREWVPRLLQGSETGKVALVFGPEDKGLRTEELALCTQMVQIPSSDAFPALNLAQAVMVCCYELFAATGQFVPSQETSPEATSEMRERMFDAWREALLGIGFMKEDKADHMMLGLRRILSRGTLTDADVRILLGIAKQASWCAGQLDTVQGEKGKKAPDHEG